MDETTKLIIKFLTILCEKVVYIQSTQIQILKWLAIVAEGDVETEQKALEMAARIESGHEQIEALLAAVRAALDS
jgi:hypothetical protein